VTLAHAAPAQQLSETRTDALGEIRALEQALADAMHSKDGRRIDGLLASEYAMRGAPDIDRAAWMRNALTLCWGERSDIDRFLVRLQADVAVASFEVTLRQSVELPARPHAEPHHGRVGAPGRGLAAASAARRPGADARGGCRIAVRRRAAAAGYLVGVERGVNGRRRRQRVDPHHRAGRRPQASFPDDAHAGGGGVRQG
jgi:hypothetical protein